VSAPDARQRITAAATDGAGSASPRALSALKTVVFAALVLLTIAALFIAQRAKHVPTPAQRFILSPSALTLSESAPGAAEQLSFQVTQRERVSVEIVNSQGEVVAQLVHEIPVTPYLRLCLQWNGRRGIGHAIYRDGALVMHPLALCQEAPVAAQPRGRLAEAGEYRVRVDLRHEGRTIISPVAFTVRRAGSAKG